MFWGANFRSRLDYSGGVNGHSIVPTKSSDMQKMGGECAFCQEKMPIVSVFGIDPMYPFTATIP